MQRAEVIHLLNEMRENCLKPTSKDEKRYRKAEALGVALDAVTKASGGDMKKEDVIMIFVCIIAIIFNFLLIGLCTGIICKFTGVAFNWLLATAAYAAIAVITVINVFIYELVRNYC